MNDTDLIELYWSRSEVAIAETEKRYGNYCRYIAKNILGSDEDSEECVNDAYLKVWESIPPKRPDLFSAFIGVITRNIALNRYKAQNRLKRKSNADIVFDEVAGIISDDSLHKSIADGIVVKNAINKFLSLLDVDTRTVFMRRYWYMSSVKDIASDYNLPEGTVKSVLYRTRLRLKVFLEKEGVDL